MASYTSSWTYEYCHICLFFTLKWGGGVGSKNQSLINTVYVNVTSYNTQISFYFIYFVYLICLDGDKIIFTLTTGTKMS